MIEKKFPSTLWERAKTYEEPIPQMDAPVKKLQDAWTYQHCADKERKLDDSSPGVLRFYVSAHSLIRYFFPL